MDNAPVNLYDYNVRCKRMNSSWKAVYQATRQYFSIIALAYLDASRCYKVYLGYLKRNYYL